MMQSFALLAVCLLSASSAWTDSPLLRQRAAGKVPKAVPRYVFNLDLPAEERWAALGAMYKSRAPQLVAYLEEFVPKWAMPIVNAIGKAIRPYFSDYGDEMIGIAEALGMKLGDIVAMNLIYQLESLGLNCSSWNNTGPTVPNDPGCEAVDPDQKWCYCKTHSTAIDRDGILRRKHSRKDGDGDGDEDEDGPGLCTSVVAQDESGTVHHGRNLDWNLPSVVRELVVDLEFQSNNKTLFVGTGVVGFVGVFNGMRLDEQGHGVYTTSLDARGKGGKVFDNLLEALLHKAMTPAQHLRKVLTSRATFDTAMDALATGSLVDEIYYISAGSEPEQGVVISRDRNNDLNVKRADRWPINTTQPDGWFRLQTNYDHWEPVPVADNRRDPGNKLMQATGRAHVNNQTLFNTMTTWPVYNHHTDYTGIFSPRLDRYESIVWLGDDALAATASACTVGYPDLNYGHCSMDSDCCQPATCFRDEREGYICVQKKQAAVKGEANL